MSPIRGSLDSNDISSEVLSEKEPQHHKLKSKEFKSWHLPRKTWIRSNHWVAEIQKFLDQNPEITQNKQFKYLTLPSTDLLDVRFLSSLLSKELQIKFLGFCSDRGTSDEEELHLSLSEVRKLPNIHKESLVVPDKFERVVDTNSKAYNSLKEFAGFDAINIDLCDALTPSPQEVPSHCDGIKRILDLQMEFMRRPWLFFLTTRTDSKKVNQEDVKRLLKLIQVNANDHKSFKEGIIRITSTDPRDIVKDLDKIKAKASLFTMFYSIGISKWFVKLMASGSPLCVATISQGYCYRVEYSKSPNLLSICFLMKPVIVPRTDPTGIVNEEAKRDCSAENYERAILEVLQQINGLKDVDKMLRDDKRLFEKMIEITMDFLKDVRYDINTYKEWVRTRTPRAYRPR